VKAATWIAGRRRRPNRRSRGRFKVDEDEAKESTVRQMRKSSRWMTFHRMITLLLLCSAGLLQEQNPQESTGRFTRKSPETAEEWLGCRLWECDEENAANHACVSRVSLVRPDLLNLPLSCQLHPPRTHPMMVKTGHGEVTNMNKAATNTSNDVPERAKKVIEPEVAEERRRCRNRLASEENPPIRACVSSVPLDPVDLPTLPFPCVLNPPRTHPRMVTRLGRHSKEHLTGSERSTINTSGWNRRLGGPRTAKCSPICSAGCPEEPIQKAGGKGKKGKKGKQRKKKSKKEGKEWGIPLLAATKKQRAARTEAA
jgi:hypothetical protein